VGVVVVMLPFVKSLESQSKCFRQNAKNSKLMPLKCTHPLEPCPRLKYICFTIRPHTHTHTHTKNHQGFVVRFGSGGGRLDCWCIYYCSFEATLLHANANWIKTLWETNPLLDNCAIVKKQVIFNCIKYYTTMRKHYEMGYFGVVPLTRANQTDLALQRLNEILVACF